MSVNAIEHGHHGAPQKLSVQFEDIDQQNESYVVGMWTFLVTEIMFFGALFTAYIIYRWMYTDVFIHASRELDVKLGFVNTLILLTSSLTMALGVRCAQLGQRKGLITFLLLTIVLAFGFLIVKTIEYSTKIHHHLVPGPNFQWHEAGVPAGPAQLFFAIYFCMTGLHGIHVIIGILLMGILAFMAWRRHPAVQDYMPIELAGLYWHFVDIVWIFLYPLLYLIHPHL